MWQFRKNDLQELINSIEKKPICSNFVIKTELNNLKSLLNQPVNKVFKPFNRVVQNSYGDESFRKSSSFGDLSTKFTDQTNNDKNKNSTKKTFLVKSKDNNSHSLEGNPLCRDSQSRSLAINKNLKDENQCELFLEVMKESKLESLFDCIVISFKFRKCLMSMKSQVVKQVI